MMILSTIRQWSLARRLSLSFTLSMAALIIVIFAVIYTSLVVQLKHRNGQEMERILQSQRNAIANIHDGRRLKAWQQRWVENFDPDKRVFLRIFDGDGKLFAASPHMPVESYHFPSAGKPYRTQVWFNKQEKRKVKMLLATENITLRNGETWVIQVALNASQERELVELSMHILRVVGIAAVLFTALLSWLIVRTGLKPLNTLNQQIQNIHIEKLNTRIGQREWPAELKALAASFDGMLERLERSFTELSRFSSDIAHEFRAPINNIIAAASVIQSRVRPPEEYQETLAKISEEGERLSRMITSMLFLARADNAKEVMHPEAINAGALFSHIIDFFSMSAEEKQITLAQRGDATLHADPLLLGRALSNLADNALRYTPPGGHITLEAAARGNDVLLSVTDSGSGIKADDLPHVFERFYRADYARTDRESSGLGLAMVKSIAELHHGSVSAESTPGEGSRFTLCLPGGNTVIS